MTRNRSYIYWIKYCKKVFWVLKHFFFQLTRTNLYIFSYSMIFRLRIYAKINNIIFLRWILEKKNNIKVDSCRNFTLSVITDDFQNPSSLRAFFSQIDFETGDENWISFFLLTRNFFRAELIRAQKKSTSAVIADFHNKSQKFSDTFLFDLFFFTYLAAHLKKKKNILSDLRQGVT